MAKPGFELRSFSKVHILNYQTKLPFNFFHNVTSFYLYSLISSHPIPSHTLHSSLLMSHLLVKYTSYSPNSNLLYLLFPVPGMPFTPSLSNRRISTRSSKPGSRTPSFKAYSNSLGHNYAVLSSQSILCNPLHFSTCLAYITSVHKVLAQCVQQRPHLRFRCIPSA